MAPTEQATQILNAIGAGDKSAADQLMPLVYRELHGLAEGQFRRQPADHTLQPTALVHEAFLRLINQSDVKWKDRSHFFAVAATAMRQILTDHARRKNADKRGGDWRKVELHEGAAAASGDGEIDLIALDDALGRLEAMDARKHRVVELRFFGGLTVEEIAALLDVSITTVESDWRSARAWLMVQLADA